jgi:hypothetical protein
MLISIENIVEIIKTKAISKDFIVDSNPINEYADSFLMHKKEVLKQILKEESSLELSLRFIWCWSYLSNSEVLEQEDSKSANIWLHGVFKFIEMGIPDKEFPELRTSVTNVLKEWSDSSSLQVQTLKSYTEYLDVAEIIWDKYQNDKRFKMYFDAAKAGNYL